ncbi:30S ribosome-binding factor RbfA [Paludicola sp. MB14-C6]|uniref:30S ribosome-binding factor RbfA n=1 Tax=Paludihabitans sp. MB14-C6 TaxID=3070656 RepID=UPI0027DB6F4D|nr:30S ribosome-binding factor RbfA [Paludicola sp. MB14-C6]WMJ23011.1 30S ribosome-binding factor RbfA [Paludicola sp. MB14-C6]
MASFKIGRISEDLKQELSMLFRELKDPRISKMLSIIKLNLSNDLSHCKVYVSAIEGFDQTVQSVEGLKSASGYIRKEISSRLHLRKTPEFHFIADDSIEYSANINKMIETQLRKTTDSEE